MQTEDDPNPAQDWVEASGVHAGDLLGGDSMPRLHRVLLILGPLGLAIAIVLSLWSMSRHVERSVNVQVETTWVQGEQLALRTQLLGPDLAPLDDAVTIRAVHVDEAGSAVELGTLEPLDSGLSQAVFEVPAELPAGDGTLELHYDLGAEHRIEPFVESIPVEIVAASEGRDAEAGRQVVSEHMLQWADDTDEQPEGVRIDLRPDGRLLAGFDNRLFVRVTDPAGKPWRPPEPKPSPTEGEVPEGDAPEAEAPIEGEDPATGEATSPDEIEVRLVSGEFGEAIGKLDDPPVVYRGPVDALGLAHFHGVLSSDVVRFEVRLPTKVSRKLRFVSHAGTVRIQASTDFAHPGETVKLVVEAISGRKPVFVDLHAPDGAWVETVTPPLIVPQEREWVVPASLGAAIQREGAMPFAQFEAYQSTLRPEDSSAIARIQVAPVGSARSDTLAPLIARQRAQLDLPRVDRNFEIGRERAYLSEIERQLAAKSLSETEVDRARAFLIGSLEAVVHGPPQSLNTRAREDELLAKFKHRWTLGIRWLLLGGGGLYIFLMSLTVWRGLKAVEKSTTDALGLVEGSGEVLDEEMLADQSLAIVGARRQTLGRGLFTIVLMVATLILTIAMLESLVWEY